MAVSYNRLWKLLIDRKMKRVDLQRQAGLSANVLARMGKDEYISMESLDKICQYLHCEIGDIVKVVCDSPSDF